MIVTAARMSDRSRIGALLPDLFNVRLSGQTVGVILLCRLVRFGALLLGPANFELRFTIYLVSKKTIVNSFVMFFLAVISFATSLPRVERDMVLFLCFSFTVPSTIWSPLLDHVVRAREIIQS